MKITIKKDIDRKMKAIKKMRKNCNYDQKDLARLIGVNQRTISAWELGIKTPKVKNLLLSIEKWSKSGPKNGRNLVHFSIDENKISKN